MSFIHRVAITSAVAAALATGVEAQSPPAAGGQNAPNTATTKKQAVPAQKATVRRSVVHHNPYPYPSFYRNDETSGFRNPGGVGRFREYYPPGDEFQLARERDPTRVASFDRGGGAPDRAEQLQAESIGIARYNSIQGHIDNYARPYFGYGLGVGFFGGFN